MGVGLFIYRRSILVPEIYIKTPVEDKSLKFFLVPIRVRSLGWLRNRRTPTAMIVVYTRERDEGEHQEKR